MGHTLLLIRSGRNFGPCQAHSVANVPGVYIHQVLNFELHELRTHSSETLVQFLITAKTVGIIFKLKKAVLEAAKPLNSGFFEGLCNKHTCNSYAN